jgi:hypothetical protein
MATAWSVLPAILASTALAQQPATRGFAVDPDVALRVHNLVGLTRIVGWDLDSVAVEATIPKGGGQLYAGGQGKGGKVGIEMPAGSTIGSTLILRVPRDARAWVKSASARVEIEGLRGEVEVNSVTGSVRLDGDPRVATLETIDGEVVARGAATVLRVRTGAGRVDVIGARGDLAVTTVQGPIRVAGNQLLAARLESVSGSVEVTAGVVPAGRLEIQTHDGDVRVALPQPLDARFDLSSVAGKVTTRLFDRPERAYPEGTASFAVGPSAGTARGALVTIRTFKGSIRVDSNPKL